MPARLAILSAAFAVGIPATVCAVRQDRRPFTTLEHCAQACAAYGMEQWDEPAHVCRCHNERGVTGGRPLEEVLAELPESVVAPLRAWCARGGHCITGTPVLSAKRERITIFNAGSSCQLRVSNHGQMVPVALGAEQKMEIQ